VVISDHQHDSAIQVSSNATLFNLSVLGDRVNLASRIEGLNKGYSTNLLIAESTMEACGNAFLGLRVDRVRVVGKANPTLIYTVVGRVDSSGTEANIEVQKYEENFDLYASGKFIAAEQGFSRLKGGVISNDFLNSKIEQCKSLREMHNNDQWDGIITMNSK
jgi:adenylate cyclase